MLFQCQRVNRNRRDSRSSHQLSWCCPIHNIKGSVCMVWLFKILRVQYAWYGSSEFKGFSMHAMALQNIKGSVCMLWLPARLMSALFPLGATLSSFSCAGLAQRSCRAKWLSVEVCSWGYGPS